MKKFLKKGFTLIEVNLSIVLMVIFLGISIPLYNSLFAKNDLDIAVNAVVQNLRRAQILSQSSANDSSWGVRTDTGNVILFQGSNFTSRDENADEYFPIKSSIIPSGTQEIVFEKFTGIPNTGVLSLVSSTKEERTISINSKGILTY